MKILFVTNLYPPNAVGGYERLCHQVASALSRNHQISVLTSTYGCTPSRHDDQRIHQALRLLVGQTIYDPFPGSAECARSVCESNSYYVSELIRREDPDVIYCWSLYGLAPQVLEDVIASKRPTLIMLTDNWLVPMWAALSDSCRESKNLCAVYGSEFMKNFYHEKGVRLPRETIIHNGVSLSVDAAAVAADRSSYIENGKFKILFAGRVVRIKGVHTAVAALGRLRRSPAAQSIDFSLTIVGDQADSGYLRELHETAKDLGCDTALKILGTVPSEKLYELFQQYDCLVFPSLYEPFALTLIMAMDAGLPTIATNVGGNTEIVVDGESGLLISAEDEQGLAEKIQQLSESGARRCALSVGARRAASKFSFEKMISATEALLLRVGDEG